MSLVTTWCYQRPSQPPRVSGSGASRRGRSRPNSPFQGSPNPATGFGPGGVTGLRADALDVRHGAAFLSLGAP